MSKILYEITINGEQSTCVGAADQSSISLRLTSADVFPAPNLSVSAFNVEDEDLKKHYQWDFPDIQVGDEVTIRVLNDGKPDEPTRVDKSNPNHTEDERAMMRHEIKKLKTLNTRYKNAVKQLSSDYEPKVDLHKEMNCSFCGRAEHEVQQLIAGPAVYICDTCVDLCLKIREEDS